MIGVLLLVVVMAAILVIPNLSGTKEERTTDAPLTEENARVNKTPTL